MKFHNGRKVLPQINACNFAQNVSQASIHVQNVSGLIFAAIGLATHVYHRLFVWPAFQDSSFISKKISALKKILVMTQIARPATITILASIVILNSLRINKCNRVTNVLTIVWPVKIRISAPCVILLAF